MACSRKTVDPQSLPSRHLTLCTVREPCDGWGAQLEGVVVHSQELGVGGSGLYKILKHP